MTVQSERRFLNRFESIRRRIRGVRLAAAVLVVLTLGVACVVGIAGIDYHFELERTLRVRLLGGAGIVLGAAALAYAFGVLRNWTQSRTASELERMHPEVGQRVRTSVQFQVEDVELQQQGVAPTLVAALQQETAALTEPLNLQKAVPYVRLATAGGVLAIAGLLTFAAARSNPEWATALRRTVLDEVPYSELSVKPGNTVVDEGKSVRIEIDLSGRQFPVTLATRPASDADSEWTEQTLDADAADVPEPRTLRYSVRLSEITEPMLYRVTAGKLQSEVGRIDVRYPLEFESIECTITPPAYTGLTPRTVHDGNVTALQGSHMRVDVVLDRPAAEAQFVLQREYPAEAEEIPQPQGRTFTFETTLTEDFRWRLAARSTDGTELPKNLFRVRVTEDRPPQISFHSPAEQLEVNSLAEILMEIQARDDYGLTRSGIVFQINNTEEHMLLEEDLREVADAVADAEETGVVPPKTRALLDRVLPLEYFSLTQRDCVIYYAFAEDNFPQQPHRTESKLRFVDIRPFKMIYRLPPDNDGNGGAAADFTSLGELIKRERLIMNRTLQVSKRSNQWGDKELKTIDGLVEFQKETADATRELAEGLIQRGADDVDVLYQAEAAMLAAVDSLSVGSLDPGFLQEKDAQQSLVEARDTLEIVLQKLAGNSMQQRQSLAELDRRISQKLRRDRENDEQAAQETLDLLTQIIQEEREIAGLLGEMGRGGQEADEGASSESGASPESESAEGASAKKPKDAEAQAEAESGDAKEESDEESKDEKDEKTENGEPGEMPEEEPADPLETLAQRQDAVVTMALDVQRRVSELADATELARERVAAATEKANEGYGSIKRKDVPPAAEQTADAAEKFLELAVQLQALTQPDAEERLASGRNLAAGLAQQEREVASKLKEPGTPEETEADEEAEGSEDKESAEERQAAERIAERAKTLNDVLRAIAEDDSAEGAETAGRVAELAEELKVPELAERTTRLPDVVEQKPSQEAALEADDLADRTEVTALELDQLYRKIVAPRMEKIAELEERAAELQREMSEVGNRPELQEFYQDAVGLSEDLEEMDAGGTEAEEFDRTVRGAKSVRPSEWKKGAGGRFYVAPARLQASLSSLISRLQQEQQELVLLELVADRDEAAPPKYEPLIQRYLQVLSQQPASDDEGRN